MFEAEAARIGGALREVALRIDHIGSTAVPGLAGKPVVDIQVSVASFDPELAYREHLELLEYFYRPDEETEHRFFRWPPPGRARVFQIHLCEAGGAWERRHLAFRDYLRVHPEVAAEYADLKRECAERFRDDRLAYLDAKAPFISRAEAQALAWTGASQ